MNKHGRIFILCPDDNEPFGGVKQLYRHADVLNKNKFDAFILHAKKGFRCMWFENNTKIVYGSVFERGDKSSVNAIRSFFLSPFFNPFYVLRNIIQFLFVSSYRSKCIHSFLNMGRISQVKLGQYKSVQLKTADFLAIPEIWAQYIPKLKTRAKIVILNQNPFNTFWGGSFNKNEFKIPYFYNNVVATIVFSEHNLSYMKYIFPHLKVYRAKYGYNSKLFKYSAQKRKQIAFMPRKCRKDAIQIVEMLKIRRTLQGFEMIEIHEVQEKEVAEILRESLIFLSFSQKEGLGMPVAEAMACGCIVIGYHGQGGKELFKEEFSYPIEYHDLINFTKKVEEVIRQYEINKEYLIKKGELASQFIHQRYSLESEEAAIVRIWTKIIKSN